MPPVVAAISAVSSAIGAALSTAVIGTITVGQILTAGYLVYGAVKQRRMEKAAIRAYNDRLTDRKVTYSDADAPWQIVYGRSTVGGRIVAQLTSGDRDQYQHLVVVWADHESDGIEDLLLNGVPVGALDSNGYATGGKWFKASTSTPTATVTLNGSGSATLPLAPDAVLALSYYVANEGGAEDITLPGSEVLVSGSTVTVKPAYVSAWAGRTVQVSYRSAAANSMVRVKHYLGATGQVADPTLIAECPGDWSSTDILTGKTYSIIRYSLDEPEFQAGPMQPTVLMRGKKVYDPRTGNTVWSQNNALCTADFMRGEYGKALPANAILYDSVAASANVCDESVTRYILGGPIGFTSARFTCNGAFNTDADPDDTLTALCQSMAGFVTFNGGWHMQAGAYTAPVLALTDADNAGSVRVLPAADGQQMVNGMRGQFYDGGRLGARTDYTPYRNAAFVTADGGEDWGTLNLPFTESNHRCAQIARIEVERRRGMQIVYPAKLRAARLRVGQRVTLSCAALNLTGEVFRVVAKQFVLGGPVLLTLAQDDASYYDLEDAPADLVSPTASSRDPWLVDDVDGMDAVSDSSTVLIQADGTVLPRVLLSVDASTDAYVTNGGALQLESRLSTEAEWRRHPDEAGSATQAYLLGLEINRLYILRARWRNGLGALGDWASTTVLVQGKTALPGNVQGFGVVVIPTGLRLFWLPSKERDNAATELHEEATWNDDTRAFFDGKASAWEVRWPSVGPHTYLAKHRDTSGNRSPAAARLSLVVNADNTISAAVALWRTADGLPAYWRTAASGATGWRTGALKTINLQNEQLAPDAATTVLDVRSINTATRIYGYGDIVDCGVTFSAARNCRAIVRAEFDASGGVFESTRYARVFLAPLSAFDLSVVTQPDFNDSRLADFSAAQLGEPAPVGASRTKCSISRTFGVTAGVQYLAGLLLSNSVAMSDGLTLYGATLLTAEIIKS